jgi:hypothetical protein
LGRGGVEPIDVHITKVATAVFPFLARGGLQNGGGGFFAEVLEEGGAATGGLCAVGRVWGWVGIFKINK